MKTSVVWAALAAPALLALLSPTATSQITLDLSGGIAGENVTFKLTGTVPGGEFAILTMSDTTGPLPMSLFFPGDPSFIDQDVTMFNYPSYLQGSAYPTPFATTDLSLVSPALAGYKVFCQVWTTAGGNPFVDLKSNVVTLLLGAHAVSTPTHLPPINPHSYAASAVLQDGNVLIAGGGGGLGSAGNAVGDIYDYKTCSFISPNNAPFARAAGQAVALNDGRVLICGGVDVVGAVTSNCEVYDPATKQFLGVASMGTARVLHTAIRLNDGRVYVCGGSTSVSGTDPVSQLLAMVASATNSAEIFNPATNTWSVAASLSTSRTGHSAGLLPDGRVLVTGGVQPGILGIPTFLTSSTRYNPATNTYAATAAMPGAARAISTYLALSDGRIMVAGGVNANIATLTANAVSDVSIYNNATNTWQSGPALALGRYGEPGVLLPNGHVIVGGGVTGSVSSTTTPVTTASVEEFNPGTNSWTTVTPMLEPRAAQAAHLTPDGKRVLFSGGANDFGTITPGTAELYVP